jgi:hypothetical protein
MTDEQAIRELVQLWLAASEKRVAAQILVNAITLSRSGLLSRPHEGIRDPSPK